jgi:hypothetical protein
MTTPLLRYHKISVFLVRQGTDGDDATEFDGLVTEDEQRDITSHSKLSQMADAESCIRYP